MNNNKNKKKHLLVLPISCFQNAVCPQNRKPLAQLFGTFDPNIY